MGPHQIYKETFRRGNILPNENPMYKIAANSIRNYDWKLQFTEKREEAYAWTHLYISLVLQISFQKHPS